MVDGDAQDYAEGHDLHSVGIGKKMDIREVCGHAANQTQIRRKSTDHVPFILIAELKASGGHYKLKNWLFFRDESGQDHQDALLEMHSGVALHSSKVLIFVQSFIAKEGDYIRSYISKNPTNLEPLAKFIRRAIFS